MKKTNFVPNNTEITDADVVRRVKSAVEIDIEKRRAMNVPIAVFDPETGNVYAEYNDGRRQLMGSRIKHRNYGERANG